MIFAQILRTQWTWTRVAVLTLAVASFAAPTVLWRVAGVYPGGMAPLSLIGAFFLIGPTLTMLALLGAFVIAALPWTIDAETRHVYALTLPVPWSRFVAMRYAAGALSLLLPALSLLLGSVLVLAQITLPDVMRAYPVELSLRYLLALLLTYSGSFALQYLFGRRATLAVLVILIGSIACAAVLSAIGANWLTSGITRWLFEWPGPFAVYTEPWRLIDV